MTQHFTLWEELAHLRLESDMCRGLDRIEHAMEKPLACIGCLATLPTGQQGLCAECIEARECVDL